MNAIFTFIALRISALYERLQLYVVNPCDVDAIPMIGVFGRAAARFSTLCPCCSGVRVLATAALVYLFPWTVWGYVALYVLALAIEMHGQTDTGQQ